MNARKKNPWVYLQDIISAIERIREYIVKGKEDFLRNVLVQDAVIRQLSIIGEVAAKLPVNLKKKHTEIPWKKIVGMRNIIIHDYSETDIPTIWVIIERDLPALRRTIKTMLEEETT